MGPVALAEVVRVEHGPGAAGEYPGRHRQIAPRAGGQGADRRAKSNLPGVPVFAVPSEQCPLSGQSPSAPSPAGGAHRYAAGQARKTGADAGALSVSASRYASPLGRTPFLAPA